MNRLCIYLTYNKENKIYPYMGHILAAMKNCVSKLYVVCNYDRIKDGTEYVLPYADNIIYRENKGYDAGAYKDMLCDILGWDEVAKYDELIFMNDSFFGPFFPMELYFERMEAEKCDFWGITRSPAGIIDSIQYRYRTHVHSYFLAFHANVLKSSTFRLFWEKLIYPKTFAEAVRDFEIDINYWLEENGFVSKAFTDVWGLTFAENEIPFLWHSYKLVKDYGMPFLKKKNLLIRNKGFQDTLAAIRYIEEQTFYPTEWIWSMLDAQFHIDGDFSEGSSLERFVSKYRKIYIYGAGVCGKNLLIYFDHKGWKTKGLIVSDKSSQDVECLTLDEAVMDGETGIVVSVIRPEVAEEIVKTIGNRCIQERLFLISDCGAIRIPV